MTLIFKVKLLTQRRRYIGIKAFSYVAIAYNYVAKCVFGLEMAIFSNLLVNGSNKVMLLEGGEE